MTGGGGGGLLPGDAGILVLRLLHRFGRLFLQHLPEPGFLLLFREDEAWIHSNREALFVPAPLTLFPVGASDVALVVVFADVTAALHVGLVGAPEEGPTRVTDKGAVVSVVVVGHFVANSTCRLFCRLHLRTKTATV